MKKITIFIGLVLTIYFFFSHEKVVKPTTKQDIENDKTEASTPVIQAPKRTLAKPTSVTTTLKDATSEAIKPLQVKDQTKIEKPEETTVRSMREITPDDWGYAVPPDFLNEISRNVFKLYYPTDIQKYLLAHALIADIRQAFNNGIYPTAKIFKGLGLTDYDTNSSFVDFASIDMADDRAMLSIAMSLHTNYKVNPIQGFFSLKVNGIENSCTSSKLSPFKNIVISKNDPGQILIKSCNESFYLQIYKQGRSDMTGLYYEKMNDGSYKVTGQVELMKASSK